MVPSLVPRSCLLELSAYPGAAIERGWFLRQEPIQVALAGQATLTLIFQYAPRNYPLAGQPSIAQPKTVFEKLGSANRGLAAPSRKPRVAASSASGRAEANAG